MQFPDEPVSVLDPCAGTGAALVAITENSRSERYGVELDSHSAFEARTTLDEVIQGNAFDAKAPVESFFLLYLNPPYDFEVGEGKNQRMEKLFRRLHCYTCRRRAQWPNSRRLVDDRTHRWGLTNLRQTDASLDAARLAGQLAEMRADVVLMA